MGSGIYKKKTVLKTACRVVFGSEIQFGREFCGFVQNFKSQ